MPSTIAWFRSIAHYGLEFSRPRLQDVTGVVTGQGRFCFGSNRLLSSLLFSTIVDLNIFFRPGTIVAGRKDSLVHRKRNLFVFSFLSRTFSIPSVSGPVYQNCGYHINCLISDTLCKPSAREKLKFPMAVASSNVTIGDCIVHKLVSRCTHHRSSKYNVSTYYREKTFDCCFSVCMNSKSRERPDHASIFGYFLYNAIRTSYKPYLWSWSDSKELESLLASTLMGTAPDGLFNNSLLEVQQGNAIASSKGAALSDTSLKLLSGSCCMPHPDKEESGGEDAHFICSEAQAIGVADGVGGWAELGVDAGQYARELMSNAVTAVREEPKGSIDPARVLEKAHSSTKVKGSSTACIIALTDQGLHAINLGDSGFIVVRDGCTVFRSPVQQHGFNFTFQLESGDAGDLPSSGQEFSVPVAPGDVIIAGTDGLFDNLYSNEVTEVVVQALRASLGPEATAQKIAALARQRAQDRNRQTPFSTAAQDAGFQYYGGKLDDITVVVSYITSCNKEDDNLPPQASR